MPTILLGRTLGMVQGNSTQLVELQTQVCSLNHQMLKTNLHFWFDHLHKKFLTIEKIFSCLISIAYKLNPYRGACPGYSQDSTNQFCV